MVKILGLSLLAQAAIAWIFRDEPHRGVAKVLAGYQIGGATMDWVMWLVLLDDGVFGSLQARAAVVAAIVSHYALGALLLVALRRQGDAVVGPAGPAAAA